MQKNAKGNAWVVLCSKLLHLVVGLPGHLNVRSVVYSVARVARMNVPIRSLKIVSGQKAGKAKNFHPR